MELSPLTDGVVSIRRYRDTDVEPLYEAVRESIADLKPWMPWCNDDYSLQDASCWVLTRNQAWHAGEEYSFLIVDASTGSVLGGVGLNEIRKAEKRANLGYWVRSSCRGRGVAARAAVLMAKFGLRVFRFERIEIVVAVGNKASQSAAKKTGAREERIAPNRITIRDELHDAIVYSLSEDDFANGKS
jgi:RimJ/RimL family protein N-acetyltransferase